MRAWVAASVLLFGVRGAHAKEGDAQVTVRGQRPRDAASEVRLDAAVLAASSARSVDDLLRQIPGVLVVQHGAEGKGVELVADAAEMAAEVPEKPQPPTPAK